MNNFNDDQKAAIRAYWRSRSKSDVTTGDLITELQSFAREINGGKYVDTIDILQVLHLPAAIFTATFPLPLASQSYNRFRWHDGDDAKAESEISDELISGFGAIIDTPFWGETIHAPALKISNGSFWTDNRYQAGNWSNGHA